MTHTGQLYPFVKLFFASLIGLTGYTRLRCTWQIAIHTAQFSWHTWISCHIGFMIHTVALYISMIHSDTLQQFSCRNLLIFSWYFYEIWRTILAQSVVHIAQRICLTRFHTQLTHCTPKFTSKQPIFIRVTPSPTKLCW